MEDINQTNRQLLRLVDNLFGEPNENDQGRVISPKVEKMLSRYDGMELDKWGELGVAVFPNLPLRVNEKDDESSK